MSMSQEWGAKANHMPQVTSLDVSDCSSTSQLLNF